MPPRAADVPSPRGPLPFLGPFAGASGGAFFGVPPSFVKPGLPPGASPIPAPSALEWVWNAVTLRHVWASPNTVWALIALAVYAYFPYDLSRSGAAAAGPFTAAFFRERCVAAAAHCAAAAAAATAAATAAPPPPFHAAAPPRLISCAASRSGSP